MGHRGRHWKLAPLAVGLAAVGGLILAGCPKPGQAPQQVAFKCEVRCTDHIFTDGAEHIITRAGSGVADQWSQGAVPGFSRPYIFDIDTVNNPNDHEAYVVYTVAGGPIITTPSRPVPYGGIGFERLLPDGSSRSMVFPRPNFAGTGGFSRLSAALANSQLYVCAIWNWKGSLAGRGGDILVEPRGRTSETNRPEGEPEDRYFRQWWTAPENANGDRDFVDVGCAGVLNPATGVEDLHVFGVTKDGRLLRSVNPRADGRNPWNPSILGWEDVELSIGRELGVIRHVDAASRPHRSQLAVVASTEDGTAWYLGNPGDAGQQVRDIVADVNATTAPFSTIISVGEIAAGFCDYHVEPRRGAEDDWELNIILEDQNLPRLLHTILAGVSTQWTASTGGVSSSPSLWKPFTDIFVAVGGLSPAGSATRSLAPPTIGEFPHLVSSS
jgi:hypothetical protein